MQDLETQGIAALVSCRPTPDPLVNAIRKSRAGTFVALVDRAPRPTTTACVTSMSPATTRTRQVAGEYITATTPEAKVVSFAACRSRSQHPPPAQDGFDKGNRRSKVEILDRQYGNWNRDDAFKSCRTI